MPPKKTTFQSKLKKLFKKYKRSVRTAAGFVSGLVLQVAMTNGGVEAVMTWPWQKWRTALIVAIFPAFVAWLKLGEDNPSDEELYAKVHRVKKQRAADGLEVTDPNGLPLPRPNPPPTQP